jgi:hypothetical protein
MYKSRFEVADCLVLLEPFCYLLSSMFFFCFKQKRWQEKEVETKMKKNKKS